MLGALAHFNAETKQIPLMIVLIVYAARYLSL